MTFQELKTCSRLQTIVKTHERFEKVMGWFEEWEKIEDKQMKKNGKHMVETVESHRNEIETEKQVRRDAKKMKGNRELSL